jgi:integrase
VPLSEELAKLLAAQIKACPPSTVTLPWQKADGKEHTARLLFVRPGLGMPWYRQTFQYTWEQARKKAGAPDGDGGGFHTLRHTAGSNWLAEGSDIRQVSAWLGHHDPGFTLRTYMHEMPNASERGRKVMDAFINKTKITGESARKVP